MTTLSQNNSSIEDTPTANLEVVDILSKRRPIWVLVSAFFCTGMIIVSPGLSIMTVLVFGLSVSYVLAAMYWPDMIGAGSKFYPLACASFAASLLWIATHIGADVVQMLGLANSGLFIVCAISTAIFAGLIMGEFALVVATQLFLSRNRDATLKLTTALTSKYTELFVKVE